MRFYGSGALRYPGTKRIVHDFDDGPFDTFNQEIIRHALAMGYSTTPPVEPAPVIENKIATVPEAPVVSKTKPRGRPRKEAM